MKLAKSVEPNFKIPTNNYFEHMQIALWVIAAVSVVINMYVSPALGIKTLLIIAVAMITARESDFLFTYQTKSWSRNKSSIEMLESYPMLDGLLFALLLPVGTPLYVVVFGMFFANFFVRNALGGYSYNIFSVALAARVFAGLSFSLGAILPSGLVDYILKEIFTMPEITTVTVPHTVGLIDLQYNWLFIGNTQLMLGFVPLLFLLPVAIYLLVTKTIDYLIPLVVILSVIVLSVFVNEISYESAYFVKNSIFLSGILFASVFLATDPTVMPNSLYGRITYGIVIALITVVIREVGNNADGIFYGILFANMMTALIIGHSKKYVGVKKHVILAVIIIFAVAIMYPVTQNNLGNSEDYEPSETQYYKNLPKLLDGEAPVVDSTTSASEV